MQSDRATGAASESPPSPSGRGETARLLVLVPSLSTASFRYRLEPLLAYLEGVGVEAEVAPLGRGVGGGLARYLGYLAAGAYDGVYLQRKLLDRVQWWVLRKRAKKLIFDFDDAVMYHHQIDEAGRPHQSREDRFRRVVGEADVVIAGNSYLEELARPWAADVRRMPTPVDTDRFRPRGEPPGEPPVVGWVGSRSTTRYLKPLRGVFAELRMRRPGLVVRIIADRFPLWMEEADLETGPWRAEREVAEIGSFTVGLMPLADDVWTRGKCAFKILQYGACGVPAVASPVGMNVEAVEPDVTGRFAASPEEWVEAIVSIVADPEGRRRMGEAARAKMEAEYSVKLWGPRWAAWILEALTGRTADRRVSGPASSSE